MPPVIEDISLLPADVLYAIQHAKDPIDLGSLGAKLITTGDSPKQTLVETISQSDIPAAIERAENPKIYLYLPKRLTVSK